MSMVVLEIKDKYAAVLKDDGSIHKIFNDNYNVGQTIGDVIVKKPEFKWVKPVSSIAAAFIMVFALSVVVLKTPTTFVSIDANPSIEYECNIFNRVLDVTARNDEGEEIIKNLNLKNLEINDAVNKTITELTVEGYLVSGESEDIVVSCASIIKDSSNNTLNEVAQIATASANISGINANVMSINSTMGEHKQAKALNTTTGKLALVEQYNTVAKARSVSQTETMLRQPVKLIVMNISAEKQRQEQGDPVAFSSDDKLTQEATIDEDQSVKDESADDKNVDKQKDDDEVDSNVKDTVESSPQTPSEESEKNSGTEDKTNETPKPVTPPKQETEEKPKEEPAQPVPNEEPNSGFDNKQEAPPFGLDNEIEDSLQA